MDKRKTVHPAKGSKASTPTSRKGVGGQKLVCRYCGGHDLAPSFRKRGDARCRACFKQRHGSAARNTKSTDTRQAEGKAALKR